MSEPSLRSTATPRDEQIVRAAIELHKAWMAVVNFHDPRIFSARWAEANAAAKAKRALDEEYDRAFSKLTAQCELRRQGR